MIFALQLMVAAATVLAAAGDATIGTAVFLKTAAQADNAVCLDGTPGVFYLAKGTGDGVNKWYIHHEGGGWCVNDDDCLGRSKSTLGSSSTYGPTQDLGGGYFSDDATDNPLMYNWNKVLLRYCDGGSFSGNLASPIIVNDTKVFFRGHHILLAAQQELLNNQGMSKATDVVISGCSAGGLATYLHVDLWHSLFPSSTKVVGMPDSGFFLDYEGVVESYPEDLPYFGLRDQAHTYHDNMVWVFTNMNATAGLDADCIDAHTPTGDQWKCIFAEHTAPFISTPTFALQSEYDAWQIGWVLPPNPSAMDIQILGNNITTRLAANLLSNSVHGEFLDSCQHHCGRWDQIHITNQTQATAFKVFYDAVVPGTPSPIADRVWIAGQRYPCTECCN